MKIMVVSNMAESLVNFRGPLLREFRDAGYEVLTVAPEENDPRIAVLEGMGMRYVAVPMSRVGIDPLRDLGFLSRLVALMRAERPSVVLAYTIKPVVYGMVAAWLARAGRRAALVNGLGYAFGTASAKQRVVGGIATLLYRLAGACSTVVIFQNPDDRREFVRRRLVRESKTAVVAGSGIDLERFPIQPLPQPTDGLTFLLIARLIREKGVVEFVDAARIVKARHPEARFRLLGPHDRAPGAITTDTIARWEAEGVIEYLGTTSDVRPALAQASAFVLPSYYREGIPRTALEALATGRPVITTDAPGCRETVRHGVNGFLVPPRDPQALAQAMLHMADHPELLPSMGEASRALASETFDVRRVNRQMREAMGIP